MGVVDKVIANSVPVIPRPLVRVISGRYIAGEEIPEAVETIKELNRQGCLATVDLMGESTQDEDQAAQKLAGYKQVIDAIQEHGLGSGLSVKLTGLGLWVDEDLCRANLEEIIGYAAERDRFVRIDMESSLQTGSTVELALDMHQRHDNTGTVIQACLRRSLKDVMRLTEAGVTARLCKGIYDEPREVAYKDYDVVRENYILLMEEYLKSGVYVGIATHDEYLVWHALRLIHHFDVPDDRYEFQMLLGVDEELRRILVESGYKVRVYVPFGGEWYEYSTRRLKENPKIAGYVAKDVLGAIAGYAKR
ncbi:proline dehydrogenase family protein [Rubrobacter aplysinae]|uniref:proline dehydrogenase family protein n=1 Tax=Rubrobacter aplysinae TaxID=909625 RepID=UPI00064C02F4|nr:proline dehydrogenase family protein [Rubrobacter aplysinae]